MAAIAGRSGEMTYDGNRVVHLDTWEFTPTVDLLETTEFDAGSVEAKKYDFGLKSGTGTFSGTYDSADTTGQDLFINLLCDGTPATVAIVFTMITGSTITLATAWIHNCSIQSTVTGMTKISGQITASAATGSPAATYAE